jgi:hypothetical protein
MQGFARPGTSGAAARCLVLKVVRGAVVAAAGRRARAAPAAHLENCIAAEGVLYRQDTKGTRWMPWRQEPMKDVDGCDKPR